MEKDPADLEDTELVDRVRVVDPDPDSGYKEEDGDCDCCDDSGDLEVDERNNSSL